eukprot:gene7653-biopygen16572
MQRRRRCLEQTTPHHTTHTTPHHTTPARTAATRCMCKLPGSQPPVSPLASGQRCVRRGAWMAHSPRVCCGHGPRCNDLQATTISVATTLTFVALTQHFGRRAANKSQKKTKVNPSVRTLAVPRQGPPVPLQTHASYMSFPAASRNPLQRAATAANPLRSSPETCGAGHLERTPKATQETVAWARPSRESP